MHFFNVEKNYPKAYTYLENSLLYFPNDFDARATLMQTALFLDKDEQAYEISLDLLKAQFPTQRQAYINSIQCALEAAYYEQALELSNAYLELWPDDQLISQINSRLRENDQPGYLKDLFQIN
jgi:tetratricopeptide (TPR) repeat protein